MSIRKRRWTTAQGKTREAFIVDFRDAKGQRTIKTFATEKEAKEFRGQDRAARAQASPVRWQPRQCGKLPTNGLLAVEHGAAMTHRSWSKPATFRQYTYHVRQYIEPQLGRREGSPRSRGRW